MIWFISKSGVKNRNAGVKAPGDISALCRRRGWKECIYPNVQKGKSRYAWRVLRGLKVLLFWTGALCQLKAGDTLLYQHPAGYGSKIAFRFIRVLKKRKVRFIALVHDLNTLRYAFLYDESEKTNVAFEDHELLRLFDVVICHNEHMKAYLADRGIPEEKLVCLELFDYLVSEGNTEEETRLQEGLVIAGNLDRKKSGYIYELGRSVFSCTIHLYGANVDETESAECGMVYHGSFEPEELPHVIQGRFGIVWDGNSAETCEGATGNYLRYNNPHKLSLYMAAGIPVITWREAAIADFVEANRVGITVDSLKEIPERIRKISEEDYAQMKACVEEIRRRVISGYYFYRAVDEALNRLRDV